MKKILLVVVLVVISVGLFAEFNAYGSARANWWYNMYDKDHEESAGHPDKSLLNMHFGLQSNSRFGVDFVNGDLTAKVEFGANPDKPIRLLWAKHNFGSYSIMVGQDYDGTYQQAKQVYGDDFGLSNHGAIDSGRTPQIRFEMENGFYAALMMPYTEKSLLAGAVDDMLKDMDGKELTPYIPATDPQGEPEIVNPDYDPEDPESPEYIPNPDYIPGTPETPATYYKYAGKMDLMRNALIPKINLGFKMKYDNIVFHPSVLFQMYQYNKDFTQSQMFPDGIDATIMSFLLAMEFDYDFETQRIKAHINVGQNTGNMGIYGKTGANTYEFEVEDDGKIKVLDNMTMGGFLQYGIDLTPTLTLNVGAGATQYKGKEWDGADMDMGGFLQAVFSMENLKIIPEVGASMLGEDAMGGDGDAAKEGMHIYFGAQLRYDF